MQTFYGVLELIMLVNQLISGIISGTIDFYTVVLVRGMFQRLERFVSIDEVYYLLATVHQHQCMNIHPSPPPELAL